MPSPACADIHVRNCQTRLSAQSLFDAVHTPDITYQQLPAANTGQKQRCAHRDAKDEYKEGTVYAGNADVPRKGKP